MEKTYPSGDGVVDRGRCPRSELGHAAVGLRLVDTRLRRRRSGPGHARAGVPSGEELERALQAHRSELTGFCYRMLGSGSEAEDAVQETMVRAWRSIDRFEGRSSLRSWLYRIANNVCIDMHRSPQRRARPMEMGPSTAPAEAKLGEPLGEHAFVQPVRRRAGDRPRRRPGRRGRGPRVDPPGVRGRPPAAARPPALGPHPLRGAALAGLRGGRAARHERRLGQQRAAAGPGHAGRRPGRAARRHGRRRPAGAARPLRRRLRALRHPQAGRRCCATTSCCRCRRGTSGWWAPTTWPAGFWARASSARTGG